MTETTRERIERALGQAVSGLEGLLALANRTFSAEGREAWAVELWSQIIDALAQDAIVVSVEVDHSTEPVELGDFTTVRFPDGIFRKAVNLGGHLGRQGKYIGIFLLEGEEE